MSIQQSINSQVYKLADRAVTPEQIKSVQAHLVRGVQDGSVPSYVGVPLLNDLNQKMSRIQSAPAMAQAMVQQPPIAQQVVGQAEQGQTQGVTGLPSGLPEQGMAGGGIVAFSDGGMSDSSMAAYLLSDEEDDEDDYVNEILKEFQMSDAAKAMRHETPASGLASIAPMMATEGKESMSVKEEGRPARSAEREVSAITRPGGVEDLLKMIEQKESGGRGDYDKYGNLLTSPKGAMGRMQVMPGTVRDPGFGVTPARDNSPDELARVGRDYYKAMLSRYNDPKLAAIAYNWGPGNTDKWITAGADMSRLPAETRQYARGFAEGGIASVKRFQYGGISGTAPFDLSSVGIDDLKRMASMGERSAIEELSKRRILAVDPFSKAAEAIERSANSIPRSATSAAAPAAAPAAPASTGIGPYATQQGPSAASAARATGLFGAPTAGIGIVGGLASLLGQSIVGGASREGREQLSADIGSDTGLAAAIMNAAQPEAPAKQPSKAGAGRGSMPASAYNIPAAQAATQRPSMQQTPVENPYTLGQEADDALAGASTQDLSKEIQMPKEEAAAAGAAEGKPGGVRGLLDEFRSDIKRDREINAYLSLLSAGLGMMGGTSPYGLANIGRGAQQGLGTYAQLGAQTSADRRSLLGAEAALEKYGMLADIRKQQFAAGQESKQAALEQKQMQSSIDAIRRYEMQAENDSRLIAQERVKQASKDLVNPITDEQRNAIYADERAKALARLRMNPTYIRLMKIATPGYDPSQVALSESDNKILSKYLNTR